MGAARRPPIQFLTDPSIRAYVAGIVDGEGTICISSHFAPHSKHLSHSLRVSISTTDLRLMVWLEENVGAGSIQSKPRKNSKWKTEYRWNVNGSNAERLLQAIKNDLVLKREQAEVALEFRSLAVSAGAELEAELVESREALKQRLHVLNKRGALVRNER